MESELHEVTIFHSGGNEASYDSVETLKIADGEYIIESPHGAKALFPKGEVESIFIGAEVTVVENS